MQQIPKDPFMLLSYVNTQLRDSYSSLEDFCAAMDLNQSDLESALAAQGYVYQADRNQFI